MSKKPYMWGKLEWLEFSQKKDWNNPTTNPDDLAKYSELQRPYALAEGLDDYPQWEWAWPDINFPDIPPLVTIDPIEHPCNIEDSCAAVGIIGPSEMECGDCFTWSHIHVILTCELQWWMAFGSWNISGETECYLLFSGPIMATVCCPQGMPPGVFSLNYEGPLECSDSVEVVVECGECCEEMNLTGLGTVTAGQVWTGTISPACPCVECGVVSNSGCEMSCNLNEAGSVVTVATGGGDCGGFTVTVTDTCVEEECEANSDSKFVTINGGEWALDKSSSTLGMSGCLTCGYGGGVTQFSGQCYIGEHQFGGYNPIDNDCSGMASVQCKAEAVQNPCEDTPGVNICDWPFGGCSTWANCAQWGWWRCKWECEC